MKNKMIQDRGSGSFFGAKGVSVEITKSPLVRDKFLVSPVKVGPGNDPNWASPVGTNGPLGDLLGSKGVLGLKITIDADTWAEIEAKYDGDVHLYAFGRYNSESDFEGKKIAPFVSFSYEKLAA
jgi:hypothetical protein